MAPVKLFPSLLSADFGRLQEEIDRAEPFVDGFHFDVMDGGFVPNLTAGAPVLSCLKSQKIFDVHLMVDDPDILLQSFAAASATRVSVHVEVCTHLHRTLQNIRTLGMTAGVVLNPATSVAASEMAISLADFVLVMSVNPGFSGQQFLPEVLEKVRQIRELFPDKPIEIDGGMDAQTAPLAIEAGVTEIVSGSFFWNSKDIAEAAKCLRGE